VCRLAADADPPAKPRDAALFSVTHTAHELSVICPEDAAVGKVHGGLRAFVVAGPLAFGVTGVVSSIAEPLARAGISIVPLATYDTDYVLVDESRLEAAVAALRAAGHAVSHSA
jgi:hypothetical protein